MRRTAVQLVFVLGFTGLGILFVVFPTVDLWFTGLFYDGVRGFYLSGAWWVRLFYHLIPVITTCVVLGLLALLACALIRKRAVGPFNTRVVLYLLATLALGPGLVVHTVFKDHWGRARPRDVIEFGGDKTFTPAFVISDQCDRNCSFVAGHPSMGFYFFALAFLARRRRYRLYLAAGGFGGLVGLGRIAQGAHFLSDVIFSGVFVFVVAYILYYCLLRPETAEAGQAPDREPSHPPA